jgi:hypothetical protein
MCPCVSDERTAATIPDECNGILFTANLQTCLIGMEACSGAHFLGRTLREQGHDVKLIPAQFVKPFVKSNKNGFLDAEAIAEAVDRQNMRFVPIKTDDQLDLQVMHRVRDRLVARRNLRHQPTTGLPARAWHGVRKDASEAEAGDARDPRERKCEPDATHAQPRQPALERAEGSGAAGRCDERGG